MNYNKSMSVLSHVRKLSTSQLNPRKNHYDSLGIRKDATQGDVKGAYYELSKVYHPDKNQGTNLKQREQHSQKFRDITEAYEVLGNVNTRKLYDKGFMGDFPRTTRHHSPVDPQNKFYKSRDVRHRPPEPSGRTPIYDFDEWSKRHYGAAFKRSQEMKQRHIFYAKLKAADKVDAKHEIFLWSAIIIITFSIIRRLLIPDYDKPSPTIKHKDHQEQNREISEPRKNETNYGKSF